MHIKHEIHTSYSIKQDGKEWPLQEVSEEKDVGIVTTNDLKVSRQCAEAAAKANRVLGMMRRNFGNFDKEAFLIIYKGFIRSHMEYAIQAWSPYFKKDIDHTEDSEKGS